ncbi:Hexitol phosphatase A [Streptomyces sp. RB5]|uniref:Hexitol phosphatase A n=1 Tax=Streptomyces smaragdinus TaxID=2585196 RepID=A0A7K0CEU5_9ACTN|nr:HAD-IA family hydrolase [Streptomyces smaragdinus]MQY11284.1 Hexitol phosphatase A [Streptomyces smaragdinus]
MRLTARAVLLDMDGTLINSDASVDRAWSRWAAENGVDPAAVLPHVHGRQAHATLAMLFPERPVERNLADNARMLVWETEDTEGIVPVAGAPAFLAALRDGGVPHALVTSADRALSKARMDAGGLAIPAAWITAESVSASKPDPEGFLLAAAELGVAPADCVVFEDADAGIRAAKAAGMQVVGVGPRAAELGPTVAVETLEQVRVAPGPDGGVELRIVS